MPESLTTKSEAGTETPAVLPATPAPDKARSLWSDAWQDLRRNPFFVVSAVLIVFLVLVAVAPGLFTSVDPAHADLAKHYLGKPNYSHVFQGDWFGYDVQGRSIYSRVLYGARSSIIVGVCATAAVAIVGGVVGMIAGYYGGWIDSLLSRITDVFFGIPLLLGAIVILNAFAHRTVWSVVLGLGFLGWTQIARVMRGSVMTVKQADYVQAAKALGAGTRRIMLRHILPNAIAPVIVVSTIALGGYIATEATLSYLGIGLPPSAVSWGNDISSAQNAVRDAPHVLFFPSAMLSVTVLAFIMLGDAVRDALDPKLR
ncbi:ABC transporter permease [Streptomyces sp. NBC_01387]|uniref:ABC transporter permease n=1 Tax=unclassified Streptomyces TaxID=2593676 RepID=UPI002023C18C|nr:MULTISPECIES: ABC transporter permease [unclassified Streptomyces]MCX4548455.1 ABC transporter permease [Streptomyces sp. NBC_01500]WSC20075.1 ABC transporter permease [Streptomyces sp. NBC_01766]WSV54096.1 ABC transporter permease [Streptomyces sp. NBC_01014]